MTYATRSDLEQINGAEEVLQRESVQPAGAVDAALANADELINSYLVSRYVVPLTVVPGNLPRMAAQVARYNIMGDSATERARSDYKDVIAWLTAVQQGRIQLEAVAARPGAEPATVVMQCSAPKVFGRSSRP